jgi:hypothetical protein
MTQSFRRDLVLASWERAIRKADLSFSRLSKAVRRTEDLSTFSFRMWPSS